MRPYQKAVDAWMRPPPLCLLNNSPRNENPALKIRGQPEASSGRPLLFSHRPSLLIYVKGDPSKIVIRRPDAFVIRRANFDCHERPSTGGSLIRSTSPRD
jgi:hypothetical protein